MHRIEKGRENEKDGGRAAGGINPKMIAPIPGPGIGTKHKPADKNRNLDTETGAVRTHDSEAYLQNAPGTTG